ncbi:PucR family transcriptional regulator [Niallia sp. FSL R7-0271]|uniref:PucR family transcriptional regulator n=1 Tax=Niallia sp. FSL R7-0271 TaxID=2921678 RepID=UPI0030FAF03A
MNLTLLVNEFSSMGTPVWLSSEYPEIEIYSVRLLKNQTTLKEGILYIGLAEDLPTIIGGNNISVLLVNSKTWMQPKIDNWNIININVDYNVPKLYEEITNILELDIKLSYDKQKLFTLFNTSSSLSEKIELTHQFLINPIILIDASSKIIAMSQDAVNYRSDIKEQKEFGYLSNQNMEHLQKHKIYENTRKARYPYYDNSDYLRNGWMHGHIYIQDVEVAHIAVIEVNHSFSRYDFEIVNFLCSLISLELEKSSFLRRNKGLNHSFFLSELLNNQITSNSILNFRLKQINWKTNSHFIIFSLFIKESNLTTQKAELVAERVAVFLPNNRWILFDNKIIFIISSENMDVSIFLENESLLDYLMANKLIASVSNIYTSLVDTNKYYQQAIIAYELGTSLSKGQYLYAYQDYLVYHLINVFNKESHLETIFNSKVLKIIEYDTLYNTNLLETLNEYLTYINNPALVSNNLHIHKNTLFYRINKIKELFALDLNNGEERFNIQLTIKILHYFNHQLH